MGKRVQRRKRSQVLRERVLIGLTFLLALTLLGTGLWMRENAAEEAEEPPASEPAPKPKPKPKPAPDPEPEPEEETEPILEPTAAERLLSEMTLREKACQLLIVFPSDLTGVAQTTKAEEGTRKALESFPVGGILYDKNNLVNQKQVQTMLTKVQTYSRIPLLLTCDEEGGRVSRLMETIGTTKVGPMLDYCDKGIPKATENAAVIGRDLKNCGFNLDLAPVADVWSNPANTVIGDRAYSKDFAQAAKLVAGAVEGFHQSGVGCTLKHFPGHGDTAADTHYGSATVTKTLEELRRKELRPFQAGIEAGADAVMIGHLNLPQVDEEPAPFSHRLVTEVLREEMGFQGVVMTDGLRMKAMTDHYSSGEIAVKALSAGVDLLLCPEDPEAATTALVEAVQQGTISQERLDESVLRVLTLKEKLGLLGEVSESEPPEKVPAAA